GLGRCRRRPGRSEFAQWPELLDDAEPARSSQLPRDSMPSALVVGRRTEPPTRLALELEPFEERVERQVEVVPGLFAVGDHVEAGSQLVVDGHRDGIPPELREVVLAQLIAVKAGE